MWSGSHTAPSARRQVAAFIGFLGLSLVVSTGGGLLTAGSIADWYPTLAKPSFNPPDWIFGPVWSVLYLMMAVAAWRVWRRAGWSEGRNALLLHLLQLTANFLWSALFFGLRRPGLALLDCLLLLALVILAVLAFRRHDRMAGLLMAPYAAWVAFACVLNFAIVDLN